jgi:hypothetical protein
MDSLSLEMRTWIAEYLAGRIPVREFERRVVSKTWNTERAHDASTMDLVHEVELSLVEFSSGDRTEDELRAVLRPLVTSYSWSQVEDSKTFGTSNTFRPAPEARSADRESEAVFWLEESRSH